MARSHFRLALVATVLISGSTTLLTTGAAGAATTTVVADSMTRTVVGGWGKAETGGTYSLTHAAPFSVDGRRGHVKLTKAGTFERATIGSVSAGDVEIDVLVGVKTLPTAGSGPVISSFVRLTNGHAYRAFLRIAPGGVAFLAIGRLDGSGGPVVSLTAALRLPKKAIADGLYNVAFSVTGSTAVALQAKAWPAGTVAPGWQVKVTDRSAQRVAAAGRVQVGGSTDSSSGPAELLYDYIKVTNTTTAALPTTTTARPTSTSLPTTTTARPTSISLPVTTTARSTSTSLPVNTAPITTAPITTATTALPASSTALPVTTPSVSSASNPSGATALSDGIVASGQSGTEWSAAPGDATPWAQLSFASAQNVASVQVFGPTANWVNPKAPATAPMYGTLSFSDGSSVIVSGIAGGGGSATTVAFAPRAVTWVRLTLTENDPQVQLGLREFAAYDVGITPPRWPSNSAPGYTAPPVAAGNCSASSTPVGSSPDSSPALVCPSPGAVVSGTTTVVVSAAPGTTLTATAWLSASNAVAPVGSAVADAQGRAVFAIDMTQLTAGPTAVRVVTASTADRPLYIQLDNAGGVPRVSGDSAPSGMTLQWNDDFSAPISVSKSGAGADYAATKPSYTGGGDFGDAIFADPAWGLNTIATDDSNFLRIRLQPTGSMVDPNGWNRTHVAGIISSGKVGGSGFSAQYGYFEARMLAPAGYGSWPAFWMLNSENTTSRETAAAEVDAVELYGQFPLGSCHSLHAWNAPGNSASQCPNPNGASDSALSWHTYAAWVKPDSVAYYIDNKLVATIASPILANEPFFFMLNESLGGGWPEKLSGTGETADLYVDWVRVYT